MGRGSFLSDLGRGRSDRLRLALLLVFRASVELKPKRSPKRRKRSFGGIRLGGLQSRIVDLAREFSAAFSGPMSLANDSRPVRLDRKPDLGRVQGCEVAPALSGQDAFGLERLPAPAVKTE